MTKQEAPGGIPEWQQILQGMDMIQRARLALALGYSPATVNNWASGRNVPRPVTIKAIERRMGRKA